MAIQLASLRNRLNNRSKSLIFVQMLSANSRRILQRINGHSSCNTATVYSHQSAKLWRTAKLTDVDTTIITHRPTKAGN